MAIKNEILYQMYILLAIVVLAAVGIFAQLVKVNVVEGDELRDLIKQSYVVEKKITGERGTIFADDGGILAASTPLYNLRLDTRAAGMTKELFMDKLDSLSYYLAYHLDDKFTVGAWKERLLEAYNKGDRYFFLKNNVTYPELELLRKFPIFRRGQNGGGFIAERNEKRAHPFRMLARRTLGYVKEDVKVGLEGSFDKYLKGEEGTGYMLKTPQGFIPQQNLENITPKNGYDLYTTIDINLQDVVQNALMRGLQYHDAEQGTAILMDVKTGAIKAISNIGRVSNGWAEVYNYAVGTATEPGSTFKLASMIALLEDGYVNLGDSIRLNKGKAQFYDEEMVDASAHGLDSTTVKHAFEISSNVGVAGMIDRYYNQSDKGRVRFINRLKDLYLHLPTGIELRGEALPYIKEPNSAVDQWSGTTIPWMAIGYEEKLTPLQLLSLYNTVANDGKMMKPYLVKEIRDYGDVIERYKPTIISSRVISPSVIKKVKSLLEGVVERGTAHKLKSSYYHFAGKTGTAQMDYKSKKKKHKYQASFAGYFPAENPKYSCIVVVYEPKKNGYYGSAVAGPVFREIADKCFILDPSLKYPVNAHVASLDQKKMPSWQVGYKDDLVKVADEFKIPVRDQAKDWAVFKTYENVDSLYLLNRRMSQKIIPNVEGMGLKDALYLLENRKVKVRFKGNGKVLKQSIRGGTAAKGQTIYLRLG